MQMHPSCRINVRGTISKLEIWEKKYYRIFFNFADQILNSEYIFEETRTNSQEQSY